ncbi:nuclear transport factor 2 family protein [Actinoalloteichus caeruleus]|uniref:Ketosteroid isomerase-related protein n=1 Tax=Actinoalloteichus caeruleus DSM 43889 TaxID=1120930 RepID=A0ABT1JJ47_ACTCY|nr:nuclear transport factor 2 family protein [Actinoalloteichus caeruleus]MCP2332508.1 Ketosteroid isomerase-related protein [Actinoalloteichus caeruleus DSM 43889]
MPDDPADLLHRGVASLLAGDMAGFVDLYADDAVLELPFAPPGAPRRLEGRAAIHEYLRDYPNRLDVREITDTITHRTDDPGTIIVEFTANGLVVPTGRPYQARYVTVLSTRNGRIQHHRDYWNPLAFQPEGGEGGER